MEKFIEQSSPNEIRVVAFDFDHTLAMSEMYCASDHFNDFMIKANRTHQTFSDAHLPLLFKLRDRARYKTCEDSQSIREMVERFKKKGWIPTIITGRPENMAAMTQKNIREAKLPDIPPHNAIHASKRGKAICFSKWVKSHPKWATTKSLVVLFVDDRTFYCDEMAGLPKLLPLATKVHTFHYLNAPVFSGMSVQQQRILIIQLAAFKKGNAIPNDAEANLLDETTALETLKLSWENLNEKPSTSLSRRWQLMQGIPLMDSLIRLKNCSTLYKTPLYKLGNNWIGRQ